MRTRLDEILEEEVHHGPGGEAHMSMPVGAVKRIAERAFRHGVEQGVKMCELTLKDGFDALRPRLLDVGPPNVKPAPAEEKPQARCVHGVVFSEWCYRCSDRLKGDRRKRLEILFTVRPHNGTHYWCYKTGEYDHAWVDRRSGKDRRKS